MSPSFVWRRRFVLGSLFLFVASFCEVAEANPLIRVQELTDAELDRIDRHDVSVNDWIETRGEPNLTAGDFLFHDGDGFRSADPGSFNFRVWLGWHDLTDRLYCAVEAVDDDYMNTYSRDNYQNLATLWEDAYLWFIVDGDHSGGDYAHFTQESANRGTQIWFAIPSILGPGRHVELQENGFSYRTDWFLAPGVVDGGGGAFGEKPTIIVNEFFITPFDNFVHSSLSSSSITDLALGGVVGLQLVIIDRDEGKKRGNYSWGGTGDVTSADDFGDVLLVARTDEVSGELGSQPVAGSWAEVKSTASAGRKSATVSPSGPALSEQ